MATLAPTTSITIRKLDNRVKERLRVRAARNGRSMEAEARSILSDTLSFEPDESPNLAEAIRRRVAPLGGIELEEHPAVATCDVGVFEGCGLDVINPWREPPLNAAVQ